MDPPGNGIAQGVDATETAAAAAPVLVPVPVAPPAADGLMSWQFERDGLPLTVVVLLDGVLVDDVRVPFAGLRDVAPVPEKGPLPWEQALRIVDAWAELRARGKGRTGRRLLRLASELQWPSENEFFRAKFDQRPYCYLETHYSASASLPSFGRLYISYHVVAFHAGGVFSETVKVIAMRDVQSVALDGRTVTIATNAGAPFAVTVVLASECHEQLLRVWRSFQSTQTFGVRLHELQARHNCVVPRVLRLCVEHLREHGMAEVGLFRVPGAHNVVEKWSAVMDQGFSPHFSHGSVHDVASLLKRFVAAIPGSFVPSPLWDVLKELPLQQASTAELQAALVAHAPPEWIEVARYLFAFLADLAAQKDTNKMSAENVAMVWCPVLREQVDLSQFQALSGFTLRCIVDGAALFAHQ